MCFNLTLEILIVDRWTSGSPTRMSIARFNLTLEMLIVDRRHLTNAM